MTKERDAQRLKILTGTIGILLAAFDKAADFAVYRYISARETQIKSALDKYVKVKIKFKLKRVSN